MLRAGLALTSLVLAFVALPATAGAADEPGQHSANMSYVKNLEYEARNGDTPNFGTDIEFGKIRGHKYAFAGSYMNGLQIVDITIPRKSHIAAVYDCGVTQGDVQVFRQADLPGRTFVTYTSDTEGDGTSTCYREAAAKGFSVTQEDGTGKNGTFIVDVTNPRKPKTVSFVEVEQGSHNQTVHPSGNFLYNSNSDLITSLTPAIEIYDISDPAAPKAAGELPLPTRPGLGTESHDISFNKSGTRAYSAALSQGVIIDTTDPAKPSIITSFLDPSINVWHQAEQFNLTDENGEKHTYLIVEDEVAGAIGTAQCPNGGVHVFDITGENEQNPVKVGYWNIDDVGPTADPQNSCTAHVFDIHEKAKVMTIAYYNGGVRVVDIAGLTGISLGETSVSGTGMKELGFYRTDNADSWSAKTPWVNPENRTFHLYGNDMNRGLDIYRFNASKKPVGQKRNGEWLTPAETQAMALARPKLAGGPETAVFCLVSAKR
jgi:hypothetical protein